VFWYLHVVSRLGTFMRISRALSILILVTTSTTHNDDPQDHHRKKMNAYPITIPTDAINGAFSAAFAKVEKLYDEDKLDECMDAAWELLQDSAMPRYHRMRTLLLVV
jgi:hypothetical protein